MKNFILLATLVFGAAIAGSAQTNGKASLATDATPKLTAEKTAHDFGNVEEGVQATVTFTFKNTGNAPLVLNNVVASCGCTTPKWTNDPIAPGKEGVITAIYDSKGRPGNFTKTITVSHNGEGGTDYLTIRGNVIKGETLVTPTVVNPE